MEKLNLPLNTISPGDLHLSLLRDESMVSWEGRGWLTWLGKALGSAVVGVKEGIKG